MSKNPRYFWVHVKIAGDFLRAAGLKVRVKISRLKSMTNHPLHEGIDIMVLDSNFMLDTEQHQIKLLSYYSMISALDNGLGEIL